VQSFLHHLILFTDLHHNQLVICYNRSSKFEDCTEILEMFHKHGIVDELIIRDNNDSVRGSDNHKAGIAACLPHCKHEGIVIIDPDTFVAKGWLQALQESALDAPISGVKHKGRGYIHPCLCLVPYTVLMLYLDRLTGTYEQYGDTLEFLNYTPYTVNGLEIDDDGYISVGEKQIAYHKNSTRKDMPEGFLHEFVAIIPTYGTYDHTILSVYYLFKASGILPVIVSGDKWVDCYCETEKTTHSRAALFNYGFKHVCAEHYIFHDRDILPTTKWADAVKAMAKESECFICHDGVTYGDVLESEAVGGSLCMSWKAFLKVGGFDSNMNGWGLEDREMQLRCSKILGKVDRLKGIVLEHVEHPTAKREDDKYKAKIRASVLDGSLDMTNRTNYIWKML